MHVAEIVSWFGAALASIACIYSLATLKSRRIGHLCSEALFPSVVTIGVHISALCGPLDREWFQKDESIEAAYEASNIPDFLYPPERSESSSRNGGGDEVTS